MVGYNLHTYLRSLPDVTGDDVELPIAFGTFGKPDIVVVHSYGFERHPGLVAIVLHPLQFIGIPGAVGTGLAHLCREMPDTVTQVIFQVCLCRHFGARSPGHTMVVASDVHEEILLSLGSTPLLRQGNLGVHTACDARA